MSISLYEALKFNHLKPLKLVSGEKGLNQKIDKIGILDHEIIEGIEGMFRQGDFVLTTFTPIREDMQAIERCIKALIECGVTALAIKNIYIKELADDLIKYADACNFPIFFFDEKVYFEDIIEDLMLGMQSRSHIEILESKINVLFENDLKSDIVSEMALDLNQYFYSWHQVLYLKEKRYINNERSIQIAEKYGRSRKRPYEHSVFKYKDGLMIILTYEKSVLDTHLDCDYFYSLLNIKKEEYFIGKAVFRQSLGGLDQSIKEAVYALEACELQEKSELVYDSIGIYKLLLPHKGKWMSTYVDSILKPLYDYDDGKLLETARIYIEYKGDIIKTAQVLFQHKNTIRYRLSKMKTLLNTTSDGDFYEQLSIAIKCEKL